MASEAADGPAAAAPPFNSPPECTLESPAECTLESLESSSIACVCGSSDPSSVIVCASAVSGACGMITIIFGSTRVVKSGSRFGDSERRRQNHSTRAMSAMGTMTPHNTTAGENDRPLAHLLVQGFGLVANGAVPITHPLVYAASGLG